MSPGFLSPPPGLCTLRSLFGNSLALCNDSFSPAPFNCSSGKLRTTQVWGRREEGQVQVPGEPRLAPQGGFCSLDRLLVPLCARPRDEPWGLRTLEMADSLTKGGGWHWRPGEVGTPLPPGSDPWPVPAPIPWSDAGYRNWGQRRSLSDLESVPAGTGAGLGVTKSPLSALAKASHHDPRKASPRGVRVCDIRGTSVCTRCCQP